MTLDLKLSFQPGKRVLYKVEGKKISARAGAFASDKYHIADRYMPEYAEALVNYLKGILLLFPFLN